MDVSGQFHAPGALPPRKEPLVPIRYIGIWLGTRAGLDPVVKREFPSPYRNWNPPPPDHPVRSPALYHSAIPAPSTKYSKFPLVPGQPVSQYIALP